MEYACFDGKPATGAPSSKVSAARQDYLNRKAQFERAALAAKGKAGHSIEKQRELEQEENFAEEAMDQAFGAFARLAHDDGFRACLCGRIEPEQKQKKNKARRA